MPPDPCHTTHINHKHPMKKIERLMNAAITEGRNWQLGNTKVLSGPNVSFVFLHDNKIAQIGDTFIELFDAGWQTVTTKSRLNAILQVHGCDGDRVFQKNHQWFVSTSDGIVEFEDGMILA